MTRNCITRSSWPRNSASSDLKSEAQLREIVKRGISSFKIFLAYKGAFGVDDTELYHTLQLAKELGVIRSEIRGATARNREARHQLVQNFPRVQRSVWRG